MPMPIISKVEIFMNTKVFYVKKILIIVPDRHASFVYHVIFHEFPQKTHIFLSIEDMRDFIEECAEYFNKFVQAVE